jgi:hypothetical protein
MKVITVFFAATMFAAAAASDSEAQVSAPVPSDDSAELASSGSEMTDSQTGPGAESAADVSSGPIAFGVMLSNGLKQSGTANWSSTYNATYKRYEITITGQNYYYLNFSTLVTPTGDIRYCRTDSVGGKLLIYCYDQSGAVQPARLAFTTFKAQ